MCTLMRLGDDQDGALECAPIPTALFPLVWSICLFPFPVPGERSDSIQPSIVVGVAIRFVELGWSKAPRRVLRSLTLDTLNNYPSKVQIKITLHDLPFLLTWATLRGLTFAFQEFQLQINAHDHGITAIVLTLFDYTCLLQLFLLLIESTLQSHVSESLAARVSAGSPRGLLKVSTQRQQSNDCNSITMHRPLVKASRLCLPFPFAHVRCLFAVAWSQLRLNGPFFWSGQGLRQGLHSTATITRL